MLLILFDTQTLNLREAGNCGGINPDKKCLTLQSVELEK